MKDRSKMTPEELQAEFEIAMEYNRYSDENEIEEATHLPLPSRNKDKRLDEYALEKAEDQMLIQRTGQIANGFIQKVWLRDLCMTDGLKELMQRFPGCKIIWNNQGTFFYPAAYEKEQLIMKQGQDFLTGEQVLKMLPQQNGPLRLVMNGQPMKITGLALRPKKRALYLKIT